MYKFSVKGYEACPDPYYYNARHPINVEVFANSEEEAIEKAEKIVNCRIHPDTISMNIEEMVITNTCKNISEIHPVDEFICSECGLIVRDCGRYEVDEDADPPDENLYEFEFKYCPRCGRKVIE